jgi:hypothetical protein
MRWHVRFVPEADIQRDTSADDSRACGLPRGSLPSEKTTPWKTVAVARLHRSRSTFAGHGTSARMRRSLGIGFRNIGLLDIGLLDFHARGLLLLQAKAEGALCDVPFES